MSSGQQPLWVEDTATGLGGAVALVQARVHEAPQAAPSPFLVQQPH